jgi:hypothetical protein
MNLWIELTPVARIAIGVVVGWIMLLAAIGALS